MRNKSLSIITFLLFVMLSTSGWAAVDTHIAKSAAYDDVKEAVDTASAGDTVLVPAGSATWENHLSITKGIILIGAGADRTLIDSQYHAVDSQTFQPYNYLIDFTPDADSRTRDIPFRLTGFGFDLNDNCGGLVVINASTIPITQVRVDHNSFQEALTTIKKALALRGTIYGVVDNNIFINTRTIETAGLQEITWNNFACNLGTPENIFIEDNTFSMTPKYVATYSGYGGRYVVRYNTYNYTTPGSIQWLDMHGNQVAGVYATMGTEVYGNLISEDGTANSVTLQDQRGGKTLQFFNRINSDATIVRSIVREEYGDCISPTTNTQPQHSSDSYYWSNIQFNGSLRKLAKAIITMNCCSTAEAWQPNHAYPYQYCTSFNGTDCFGNRNAEPEDHGGISGAIEPVWLTNCGILGNPLLTDGTVLWLNMGKYATPLMENREFWNHNPSYNGTTEIGVYCGPALPSHCTVGDGAWITNQPCLDLADDNVGAHPRIPISGTLYKCTAPNTWTAYYIPFTYPHPLRVSGPVADNDTQTISLIAGWNWISFNVLPANVFLNSVFAGIVTQVEQLKAQTQSAIRSNGAWKGDLADMSGIGQYKMFKVKVNTNCTLTVTGTAIAPTTQIQLAGGWNWVAYLPTSAMPITTALDSIKGQVLQIKSLTQSATYNGTTWSGALDTMQPGQGYAILMSASGTLTYQSGQ
jgi:hypothetical protein